MRRHALATGALLIACGVLTGLPFALNAYDVSLVARVGIFFVAILGLNILTG